MRMFNALCLGIFFFALTSGISLPHAWAVYGQESDVESEDRGDVLEPADTDDFSSVASVDRYLQGNVRVTTLAMIRDIGTALHKENMKTHEEIAALKRQLQELSQEVRRLSSSSAGGGHR